MMRIIICVVVTLLIIGFAANQYETRVGTGPRAALKTISPENTQATDRIEVAFVANAVEGSVTLLNLETLTIVRTLNVIPDGKKVGFFRDPFQSLIGQPLIERSGLNYAQDTDISPDGRVLYVSRGHLGDVAAFDIATGTMMWRRAIGGIRADHMTLSRDGQYLYVSALTNNEVEVIDTTTADIIDAFQTGIFPDENHVSQDGRRVFNASLGDMTEDVEIRGNAENAYLITVADTETHNVIETHGFDQGVRPFQLRRDGSMLFAQLSNTHALVEYDLRERKITRRIDLPVKEGVSEDDWDFEAPHHGLALTRDEATLCVAGRASDYAALVSTDSFTVEAIVPVGDAPSWAVIDKNDRYCVLANTRSDDVSVVDIRTKREVARLAAGRGPKHISIGTINKTVLYPERNKQ